MPTTNAQEILNSAQLVSLGLFDLRGTPEEAAAYAVGDWTLMNTKKGGLTTLVNDNHTIVSHLGLVEVPRLSPEPAGPVTTPCASAISANRAGVIVLVSVVTVGTAGTLYYVHKRMKAKHARGELRPGGEEILAEAQVVINEEFERLRPTIPMRQLLRLGRLPSRSQLLDQAASRVPAAAHEFQQTMARPRPKTLAPISALTVMGLMKAFRGPM